MPVELTKGPFTAAHARAHGVSRAMLQGKSWRRMLQGVYVSVLLPDDRALRARAASLLLAPMAFLCGESAAWVFGVDLFRSSSRLVVASRNGHRLSARPGWLIREVTVAASDIIEVDGVRVTSPRRTCFDCARWLTLMEAVVVIDQLTHDKVVSVAELRAYAARQRGIRHVRRVPGVLDLVDPRSESPQESRLRLWLIFDGFEPHPQYEVLDVDRFVAFIDLALVKHRVAVEYDGAWHADRMAADELRRADLERLGWRVVKVYASDLRTPASRLALMTRIRQEIRRQEGLC